MNYLKEVYEYLKRKSPERADDLFDAIIEKPGTAYIGYFAPPSKKFTRDFTLNHAWQEFMSKEYNIVATIDPPKGNSVSLNVTRCFINEVVRDIGIVHLGESICGCDFKFWEGYHPNMRFTREKTLLRGDTCCNHTLNWVE
jgi:hypothetical protein